MSTAKFYGYLALFCAAVIGALPWIMVGVSKYTIWVASFK